jgi:hypothetical protein
VGQTGQDRERVAALRPALAHPAAVAQAAVEELEHFDVVGWRGHVGVGGDDERGDQQATHELAVVEVHGLIRCDSW